MNLSETEEGLDKKRSLHYYSRMRFIVNLMPKLTEASPRLSRAISVFGAGGEGPLILDDLSLKENYSFRKCTDHAITMTSLAMNELSQAHPAISFIHTYPRVVKVNLTRDLNTVAHAEAKMLLSLATPWVVPLQESGERHLYIATNRKFWPWGTKIGSNVQPEGADTAMKAYLIDQRGIPRQNPKLPREHGRKGVGRTVWAHTLDVFRTMCGDVV